MHYMVIRTENLTKTHHRRAIVNNLTIEVEPGEIYGFVGVQGAGKSTTLRMLVNLIRPSSGRALLLGLNSQSCHSAICRQVGYLPETFSPCATTSGRHFFRSLEALHGPLDWAFVERIAGSFELDLDLPLARLDAGMRRCLGLVQAFMHQPELVILDEPTTGLEPTQKQAFFQLASQTRAAGSAVFFATHSLKDVEQICDRAAFIHQGSLVAVERGIQLRSRSLHRVEMRFAVPVNPEIFTELSNLREIRLQDNMVRCMVQGDQEGLIRLARRHQVTDYVSQAPSLEEAFGAYYGVRAHAA